MTKAQVTAIINALAESEKYDAKVKIATGNKPFDISAVQELDTAFDTAIAAIIAALPDSTDGAQTAAIVNAIALAEKHDAKVSVATNDKPFDPTAVSEMDDAFDSAISDVVDDCPDGSGSGDYVTLSGEQTISGDKTFSSSITVGPDEEFKIDGVNCEIYYINRAFEIDKMPLGFYYDTEESTISFVLGDGKVIDVKCTSVTERT